MRMTKKLQDYNIGIHRADISIPKRTRPEVVIIWCNDNSYNDDYYLSYIFASNRFFDIVYKYSLLTWKRIKFRALFTIKHKLYVCNII